MIKSDVKEAYKFFNGNYRKENKRGIPFIFKNFQMILESTTKLQYIYPSGQEFPNLELIKVL